MEEARASKRTRMAPPDRFLGGGSQKPIEDAMLDQAVMGVLRNLNDKESLNLREVRFPLRALSDVLRIYRKTICW